MPSWLVPTPISSSAQIIPRLSTPLSLLFLITKESSPSYKTQPKSATITFCPAATLAAPHTICCGSPLPRSTVVMCKWSEFGCSSQVSTLPTNSPFSPPRIVSTSSTLPTSNPVDVSAVANSSGVRSKSTYSFSHLYEMFIYIVVFYLSILCECCILFWCKITNFHQYTQTL